MLAISPLRSAGNDENGGEILVGDFSALGGGADNFSVDFSAGNLLEDIDFDDLFVGFDVGDVLPDLEVDSTEILAEFSVGGGEESGSSTSAEVKSGDQETTAEEAEKIVKEEKDTSHADEIAQRRNRFVSSTVSSSEADRGRKSSGSQSKNSHGKRKVKVDWTPELHRRFVQAVEQLGVDKAVPSRILELMGIDCLTRHNIASHLQKYRSHRKHMLAREAEAASWSHRRQVYPGGRGGAKREMNPWLAPTIGFPPPIQPFRPLHVWGHPTMDQSSLVHMWPKNLVPSRTPLPPPWTPQPPPPPPDPSYWHHHHFHRGSGQGWVPSALTQGTTCIPPPLPPTRFPAVPPVPGIPPHPMYKPGNTIPLPASKQPGLHLPVMDSHPTKESIDSAIGDVLSKPLQPLPLGLKPPSLDSVLVELQRQGVSKIPPSAA